MKHLIYYNIFESFHNNETFNGAIFYTNWSDFIKKFETTLLNGFTTDLDFIEGIGFDFELYQKIKNNLIHNWIDSISKSLIHGLENIFEHFPIEGQQIFRNLQMQTAFLLLCSSGVKTSSLIGGNNTTHGIGYISSISLNNVLNPIYKSNDESTKKFITVGGLYAKTVVDQDTLIRVNTVLQYVWCYYFLQKTKLSNGIKNKSIKLPKYLYRGIRVNDIKNIQRTNIHKEYYKNTKDYIDLVKSKIINDGLNFILDGKFNSFTSSKKIAELFTNLMGEASGIIVRVDTNKVNIIASELTEELFDIPNRYHGKKEREYIVNIPDEYKVNESDIFISSASYLKAQNSPLYVNHINKYDKATYDFKHDGKVYSIEVTAYWRNENSLAKNFKIIAIDGKYFNLYNSGIKDFIKEYGFNPTPTEDNLSLISNFKLYYNKGGSYSSAKWELVS